MNVCLKSISRSYKFDSCHWFIPPLCHELGSLLHFFSSELVWNVETQGDGQNVEVPVMWGSRIGLLSLSIMVLPFPPPIPQKNGTRTLAMLSTSFPIFQLWPNLERLEMCQNHYIIPSFEEGEKKNHKVPININLCNPIEFSSWLGVRRIKILPKSVKCELS